MAKRKSDKASEKPSALSTEKVVDSDSDDELPDASAVLSSSQSAVRGEKRKRIDEVESEAQDPSAGDTVSVPRVPNGGQFEEEDASQSSNDDESTPDAAPQTNGIPAAPAKQTQSHAWRTVTAQPYLPPNGFISTKFSSEFVVEIEELFDQDLRGKEVWHITAHASVPIQSIRNFSIKAAMTGKTIQSKDGVEFKLTQEKPDATAAKRLLTARTSETEFKCLREPIRRTFHLQRAEDVPEAVARKLQQQQQTEAASNASPSNLGEAPKPRRPQPKGLRLRYTPFGAQDGPLGTIGSSASEESDHEPEGFRVPSSLPSPPSETQKPKKRKHKKQHEADTHQRQMSQVSNLQQTSGSRAESAIPVEEELVQESQAPKDKDKEKKKKKKKRKETVEPGSMKA